MNNKLVEMAGAYGIELNTEESKVMGNSTSNTIASVAMNWKLPEEMSRSSQYLGPTLSNDDICNEVICTQIVTATAAMARVERIWKC